MLGVDGSAFAEGAKAHDEKSVVVATGADGVGLQWQVDGPTEELHENLYTSGSDS